MTANHDTMELSAPLVAGPAAALPPPVAATGQAEVSLRQVWSPQWASYGRCHDRDPDDLFVQGKAQREAKAICRGCPVIARCLADALDNRTEFGVWGGMTERERRALLRRLPEVTSWTEMLANCDGRFLPAAV